MLSASLTLGFLPVSPSFGGNGRDRRWFLIPELGRVTCYETPGCSRFLGTYFSISEDQLRITDRGAALGSSTRVLIRNLRPSLVTS